MKILRNPGIGLSQNRNFALDHATADIVVIADDDLRYLPEGIERLRTLFEADPLLDALLLRYVDTQGHCEKVYPGEPVLLSGRYPKGYFVTSMEIALRRRGRAAGMRFCEQLGIGAPVLKSGEETLFIHRLIQSGGRVLLYPATLCVHSGPTTGLRRVTDRGVYRGMGALTSVLYPFTFPLRFIVIAARGSRRGQMKFFEAVCQFFYGAYYFHTKVAPGLRLQERRKDR